jgi:putative mRNA 3-end processing factor
MKSLEILENYGFLPYIRRAGRRTKPHISLRFKEIDFHIDSLKGDGYNLITHAHSDHYGQYNMRNKDAVASRETAKILEATTGKEFHGVTFKIGETLDFETLKVETYYTKHIAGSTAFLIKSDSRILITGDVKDHRVPKCDVLITEATYGKPSDVFSDEEDRIIEEAADSTYGVYPIGKAQRVAKILIQNGFEVSANSKIARICSALGINVNNGGNDVKLVSPKELWSSKGKKFIITAQKFYRLPRIVLSDHLDYIGILRMIERSRAQCVIFYHGKPSTRLIEDVREMGREVITLNELDRFSLK